MLVNDREEIRHQDVPPQHLALWIQAKQSCAGKDSACIVKPSYIWSRGRRILSLTPARKDTHNPALVGGFNREGLCY